LLLRVIVKAALLFVSCNLLFAAFTPLEALGTVSLYNTVLPGRERLPYGEQPAQSYNQSLYNIRRCWQVTPRAAQSSRRIPRHLDGRFGYMGWFLENKDTLAGRINAGQHVTLDGRRVTATISAILSCR